VNWSTFQLFILIIGAAMLAIRIVTLRRKTGMNPVHVHHPSEVGFVVGEIVIAALMLRATNVLNFPLPDWLDIPIVKSELAKAAGAVLAAAGLLIFGYSLISFGDSWRIGIDRKTPSVLVTNGIFRFTRNPIFLFLDLFLAGIFLMNGTLLFLIAGIPGALFLHFQIRREEQFLFEHYGDAYRRYFAKTPRYFLK